MIFFRYPFGPGIPHSSARVWYHSWSPQLRLYILLFAIMAALFHPSEQLSSVSALHQIMFWAVGYLMFIFVYPVCVLANLRMTLMLRRSVAYISVSIEATNLIMAAIMYGFARLTGIPTSDLWDVAGFVVFNIALFELGAYCYVAYVDHVIFPEVYEVAGSTDQNRKPREIFLRGSSIPVHLVEVISASENGVIASGQGQEVFVPRPFGLVVSELPLDLGFQIHRSLWVSRDLAMNFVSEERRHFIKLPDGRRFPIARSRLSEYRSWLELAAKGPQRAF